MKKVAYFISISIVSLCLSACFFSGNELKRWVISPEGATSMALNRDGRFVLYFTEKQGISLWDLKDNKQLAAFGEQDQEHHAVSVIKISDNGRYAISATQTNFAVWDLGLGKSKGLWSISDGTIRDVAVTNDGSQVILGLSNGKAIYVSLVTGRRLEFLAHREKVNTVAVSANGNYALSGGNDYFAYLWDTKTGQILYQFPHNARLNRVALQRDGKLALTSDSSNHSKIWNLSTGRLQTKLKTFSRQLIFSCARFSDDGTRLITGSPNRRLNYWDSRSGEKLQFWDVAIKEDARPKRAVVYDVAFSDDGNIISASSSGIVQKWHVKE